MTGTGRHHAPPQADALCAVRVWLSAAPARDLDLAALAAGADVVLFDDGRRRMAGIGTALDIPLEGGDDGAVVLAHLGAVTIQADTGSPPPGHQRRGLRHPLVAFGALGFERAPTVLRVPAVLYVEEADGTRWATVTTAPAGPGAAPAPRPEPADVERWLARRAAACASPHRAPRAARDAVAIEPVGGAASFDDALDDTLASLRRGELTKVVLARHVDVDLGGAPDMADLLRRWRNLEPACTVFALAVAGGRFVGASPELLVDRRGDAVVSWPLAGTAARPPGASEHASDGLLASTKDATEHRLVVEAIARSLGTVCSSLTVPDHPDLVRLRSVDHLGTRIDGRLRRVPGSDPPDALSLARLLHPTPAVGGTPAAEALARIAAVEPAPRGPYAGPVGYVDGDGDGSFVLGIRSALLSGHRARVCAGAGLVAASDAATERAEVDLKLAAVLAALAPAGASVRAPA